MVLMMTVQMPASVYVSEQIIRQTSKKKKNNEKKKERKNKI